MDQPVFEHVRSARREAMMTLLGVSAVIAVLLLLVLLSKGISSFAWLVISGIGGCALLALLIVVIPNLRTGGFFTLRIYPTRIVCVSPNPAQMKSFELLLSEIDHVEHNTAGDSRWTIVARDGSRHEVNENYCVPLRRVMRILEKSNPPVPVVKVFEF